MSFESSLKAALVQRHSEHRTRQRRTVASSNGVHVLVDNHSLINFCSNDYLGLANHQKVIDAFTSAVKQYGVGSRASHLVCGHSQEHHLLEDELAEFTGRDRAVLFSTGYMANIGVLNALLGKKDAVFEDKLNHASLLDGARLSGAQLSRYKHNDMDHLQWRLRQNTCERTLIVTDGVFSMDGDMASMPELVQIAKKNASWLMVDDAHGIGVLGENGGGIADLFHLSQSDLPVLMGTFGKAFGTFGAFVAGSELLIETLIQFARSYIYTTAIPPAVAASTRASLALIKQEPWRRSHLHHLISMFKQGCQTIGLDLLPSHSPVQPILIGCELQTLRLSQMLADKGFWVTAIRPPTVPENTSRLRVTLSAQHSVDQVDALLHALEDITRKLT